MTLTHLPWGPRLHTLPMGRELHLTQTRPSVPAQLRPRCSALQPHLLGGPWTCVSSSVPGTISRCSWLDSPGVDLVPGSSPRLAWVCQWAPPTSACSAHPARALQDSPQAGEGHRLGFGHPHLVFTPALLLPEAVTESLPRTLAAAGLQREESCQAKARNRGICVDREGVSMSFLVRKLERAYFCFPVSWLT